MNTFNALLNIKDCLYSKNCEKCNSQEITVTSSSQTIELQCNYILNILSVTSTYSTVLIQNGFQVIIRNIRDFPMQIGIPTKNCTHVLTISIKANEVSS